MQSPRTTRTVRSRSDSSPAAGWAAFALPLFVVLASFLGGATTRWSEGIMLAGLGMLLLVRPPRFSLGPALNSCALLFLALAAVAFLPAGWFHTPAWRTALTKDFGVDLPPTLSVQPWLTLSCYATLLAGFAWLYYVTTLDADLRDIRLAGRAFAGGMIGLAALAIVLHLRGTALPFWHNVRNFGPYPNRNQTGDLFGISTLIVLACMQEDFRRRHWRWLVWLAGFGVLVAALILDFSRAGILILVLGVCAWLARIAFRKWTGAGVAVAISVLLVLFAGLLLFGGETVARFHLRLGSSDESVTSDFRWLIFRDVWTMIRASPWCGLGLGNFESVFALFRNVSQGPTRSLHPESDWLWLWSEMGWPAVALVLVALALLVRRVFPLREGTNQRLRYAALIGAILFALHGLVDVSAHRFGTFLAGTFLLGLAQHRPHPAEPRRWPSIVFRCLGVVLVIVGFAWFLSWRGYFVFPGYLSVEEAKRSATIANRGHRFRVAISIMDRGLRSAPLDWQLYFTRAVARVGLGQPRAEALADFRRARFLEPSGYQVPFEEGKTWLGVAPNLALTAWKEALRRRPSDPAGLYRQMFPLAEEYDSRLLPGLGDLAANDPRLTITYLENIPGGQFPAAIQKLLKRDPNLAQLNGAEKGRLFALWSKREALDDLVATVRAHPEWMPFAWRGIARWHAGKGEYEQGWKLVRQFAAAPALPATSNTDTIPQLEQRVYANPADYAAGYALYRAQTAAGKTDDALATVRHFTAQPGAPAYFFFLEAESWVAQKKWERAWQAWEKFQNSSSRRD
ncbi:MAG: O-antigen ligase family protein [Chthoniobacterales bacterium]